MRRSEIVFSMAGDRLVSQYAPVRDGVFWHRLRGANEIPIGLPEVSAHAATSGNYLATHSGCVKRTHPPNPIRVAWTGERQPTRVSWNGHNDRTNSGCMERTQ